MDKKYLDTTKDRSLNNSGQNQDESPPTNMFHSESQVTNGLKQKTLYTPQKYYVVWVGRTPGVYDNWGDAEKQVKCFKGATHKSYTTRDEAEQAFNNKNNTHEK